MIDNQDCEGTLKSLTPKKKEVAAGQLLRVIEKGVLDIFVTPEQFDQYFDNVQAGAAPSAWLWRAATDESGTRFLRWNSLGKIEIGVPKDADHMVKLVTVRADGEAEVDYVKSRVECAVCVRLKKAVVVGLMANYARLEVSFEAETTATENAQLLELYKQEKLLISVYQRQGDLAGTAAQPPRDGAKPRLKKGEKPDDTETHTTSASAESPAGAESEQSAGVPPAPSDDELYPQAVELVRAMGVGKKVGVPTVQKGIKVGYNRAVKLLDAMEKAGVVGTKTVEGREVLAIAEAAPAPSAAAPQVPRTPKCVQEWDEDAGQWVDNAGKRLEPQPDPPKFVNVRDLKPETGGEALE